MKRINTLFAALLLVITGYAQSPDKFNYQAVIRNTDGSIRANQSVALQIAILQGSVSGSSIFVETHNLTTSAQGLVNVVIGNGSNVSGSLNGINWAAGPFFLKISLDGLEMGTSQLLSVPYAKYAEKAGNSMNGTKPGDMMYWNGTSWIAVPIGLNGQVLTVNNGVPTWIGVGGGPIVTTTSVSKLTSNSANIESIITNDGGAFITDRGVCYGESQNPTISGNKVSAGTGNGSFTTVIYGLNSSTNYYVRAYATNSAGTGYGNQLSFFTLNSDTTKTITDIEGNKYDTVGIGTQIWMSSNLRVTKLNDGTQISPGADTSVWLNGDIPQYCWNDNDSVTYKNPWGALYNWYTVNTGKLCPTGWHVPSDSDLTVLTTFLGGESAAGGKLKEVGTSLWYYQNIGATNSSGFTWLPAGMRGYGMFGGVGIDGFTWTNTESSTTNAWFRSVIRSSAAVSRANTAKKDGLSVRCLKN
jgi:uncharacterized protein (TIGR02145 family)